MRAQKRKAFLALLPDETSSSSGEISDLESVLQDSQATSVSDEFDLSCAQSVPFQSYNLNVASQLLLHDSDDKSQPSCDLSIDDWVEMSSGIKIRENLIKILAQHSKSDAEVSQQFLQENTVDGLREGLRQNLKRIVCMLAGTYFHLDKGHYSDNQIHFLYHVTRKFETELWNRF